MLVRCLSTTPHHGICGQRLEIFKWGEESLPSDLLGITICPACQVNILLILMLYFSAEGLKCVSFFVRMQGIDLM